MFFSASVKRKGSLLILALAAVLLVVLTSCGQENNNDPAPPDVPEEVTVPEPIILMPEASGKNVAENEKAVIDYSNISDGYVMVMYKAETEAKLRALLKYSTDTYTFILKPGEWTVLPLGNGSDDYKLQVYENIGGTKYAAVLSASFTAVLSDEFAPFLRPNQYVDYTDAPNTMRQAAELVAGHEEVLSKVGAIYNFVVKQFKYDKHLAETVQSGYLPVLDSVLENRTGICFDYASLMTAMLRSQGIPCKLVVGYVKDAYHAWISVWSDKEGWIEKVIYFDGVNWRRMDPTFASSSKSSNIEKYIGDGKNYQEKYFY